MTPERLLIKRINHAEKTKRGLEREYYAIEREFYEGGEPCCPDCYSGGRHSFLDEQIDRCEVHIAQLKDALKRGG